LQTAWLEALVAIADHKSFAKAADHLYRGQGRISSYISALEREVGVRLFDRGQRPVRLTEEGEVFLQHARQALSVLNAGRQAARALKGRAKGVAVAAHPSASAVYMPGVLAEFDRRNPDLRVTVVERDMRAIDAAFESGEVSMALRPTIPPVVSRFDLNYQPLWSEPIMAVVSADHPAAKSGVLSLDDLVTEQLAIGGRNIEDTEITLMFKDFSLEPQVRHLTLQPQSIIALAKRGMAVGIINQLALFGVDLAGVEVVPISIELNREVGLFWVPGLDPTSVEAALLRTIVATPPPKPNLDLRGSAAGRFPDLFGDVIWPR
jgi:DNA-binding transcriptional LysR family regulator